MPGRWRNRHAPHCDREKEFVQSAAFALKTYKASSGEWTCRACQALEMGTAYKYGVVRQLGYDPNGYEELLEILRDSDDIRVPGRQPGFVAQAGNPDALIAARRAGKGGLAGPARTRVSLVAAWSRPGGPSWEIVLCQECGTILLRGTGPKSKKVSSHQACWWAVQRSPEGRAWMAAYMAKARGRRGTVASRPYRPRRQGRPPSPETLKRDFGWAVRVVIGNETPQALADSAFTSRQAVEQGIRRILSLLPAPEIADQTTRRYVLAFTGVAAGELPPLRARVARCGTPSGYARHRRRKEAACGACVVAERERTRAYSEKRRREAGIPGRDRRSDRQIGGQR